MNILYFCNVHRAVPNELGVLKKVKSQCLQFKKHNFKVYLGCPNDQNSFVFLDENFDELQKYDLSSYNRFSRTKKILQIANDFIANKNIQCIYSRYSNFSLSLSRFYLKNRKRGIKVLLEIPTYPISQRWTSIKQSLKTRRYINAASQIFSSTIGSLGIPFFKYSIDRIVNVNGFKTIWGIPVINITNGIDINPLPQRNHQYIHKQSINVIIVANLARWHGVDRFIEGLANFYSTEQTIEVHLDIVGPGTEILILKDLTSKYRISDYVHFHGQMFGDELNHLFENADIGISVLGVHRNNTKFYDSLKSREYCARQLPFITEQEERHFIKKDFAMIVPSDNSPIKIEDVITFYNSIVDNKNIKIELSDYASKYCSWDSAFANVIAYLKTETI